MALRPIANLVLSTNDYTFSLIDTEPKMIQHQDDAKNKISFRESRQVQKEQDGVPVWTVDVKAVADQGRFKGIMSVSVPSEEEPDLGDSKYVTFDDLVVGQWASNDRGGFFFNASAVRAVNEGVEESKKSASSEVKQEQTSTAKNNDATDKLRASMGGGK